MARILIAEDEEPIALALEDDLTLDGYDVQVVGDGVEAARRGRNEAFDLLILDVMLPGKSGFDVCRELRRGGMSTPI
jgi:two-component system alkaline phosphatase synthesis response regulator PhoP